MSQDDTAKRRFGMATLTCLLLVVFAALGLWVLDAQVEVYSFGSSVFDARFFPRIILWLIVISAVLRLLVSRGKQQTPIGSPRSWFRVFLVVIAMILALRFMPTIGFLAGAFFAAAVTALALGERKLIFCLGLPLLVAALVSLGAHKGLNIPLP